MPSPLAAGVASDVAPRLVLMSPTPLRPGAVRPSAAEAQAQIVAYMGLPAALRVRLDPRRVVLAELQRAYVAAWQAEMVSAA